MKAALLLFFTITGLFAFHDFVPNKYYIVSVLIFLLGARMIWQVLLKQPLWIWHVKAYPGEERYIVGYVFAAVAGLFMLYWIVSGALDLIAQANGS